MSPRVFAVLILAHSVFWGHLAIAEDPPVAYPEVAGLPFDQPTLKQYGDGNLQFAEYWPNEDSETLLILIHGGCWLNQFDLKHIRPLASELAATGLAVLSVEYRRIGDPDGGWPGTFEDIQAVVEFSSSLSKKNTYIAGHSAGGHLALWAAANNASIHGAIGLAAISDLVTYSKGASGCERATLQLLGGTATEQAERYQLASPLLLKFEKPILLIHGEDDPIVKLEQSTNFCSQQQNCEIKALKGKGHFDVIDPRQESTKLIVKYLSNCAGSKP